MFKRVVWITDPHLNFVHDYDLKTFHKKIRDLEPDAIFVTGDIAEAPSVFKYLTGLSEDTEDTPVFFVLGNHDFYGGSIAEVRELARRITESDNNLFWMPAKGVVELSKTTAAVGVDGWGDGRLGDPERSTVFLNDWMCIKELLHRKSQSLGTHLYKRIPQLNALGDEEAATLKPLLNEALDKYDKVFVLTHIPPWEEATWHEGAHSDPEWLPWFSCAAVGDAIVEAAHEYPDKEIVALCGHTHGSGVSQILENVVAYTGGATYRFPEIQKLLEIDEDEN
jgi:Icc-related predicted phosphoesterase